MKQNTQTRLTKNDLNAIENRIELEIGTPPTIDDVKQNTDHSKLNNVIEFISATGRVITLLVAEIIQSAAALIIAIVFGILEYWRVLHGAEALGQNFEQAALIAFAVVTANVVHPIYRLRQLQGKTHVTTKFTLRGLVSNVWNRITNKPKKVKHNWSYNPVLDLAAITITITTVFLAVFDLVSPLLTTILMQTTNEPVLILAIKLAIGFGLSVAGVFFLQAAAHEIGVRTLTDKTDNTNDLYQKELAAYEAKRNDILERVTQEHIEGKLQDKNRNFTTPIAYTNGNGHKKLMAEN